ncbi:PREDICTED: uncharacterized protein LOC103908515 [Aptenodytes forsteri]|uniref:uncharacterized protein LOC103908515 n=1 Tax=Aptenodytes forsteri TaxID=9233 RepID=UPI000904DA42|nr:PREDICTED: uncharacterized protein LOC103908515 [Aptenodytes forsteri]
MKQLPQVECPLCQRSQNSSYHPPVKECPLTPPCQQWVVTHPAGSQVLLLGVRVAAMILLERMIWLILPTILEQKNKRVILPHQKNPSFPQFLKRLAKLVGFHLIPFQESTGSLIGWYLDQTPSYNRVAMPLHPVLDKLVKKVWQTPHTVPPVSKEIERKYILLEDAVGYVIQPAHKTMVVKATMAREKVGQEHGTAPQNPELRRLDSYGQRAYQSVATALHVVDYQVYMARGQVELWKKVSALAKRLLQDQHQAFQDVILEGTDPARHQVQAAFDAGDTVARAAAWGVDAWRPAWLQASSVHEEVQTKLENLPYAGENLFGEQVEATLQRAKERQATLCFLRLVYCPSPPAAGLGRGKLLCISQLSRPLFVSRVCSALLGRVPHHSSRTRCSSSPLYRQQK